MDQLADIEMTGKLMMISEKNSNSFRFVSDSDEENRVVMMLNIMTPPTGKDDPLSMMNLENTRIKILIEYDEEKAHIIDNKNLN